MALRLVAGDCRAILPTLPAESVHCVVTSPPYWGLRDYGVDGQIGLEPTPEAWLATMVDVFREVRRVLRDDGTLWLNLGDSYNANQGAGFDTNGDGGVRKALAATGRLTRPDWLKPKDLVGMPWRLALALQADGWYLRADIIWAKPNPMPESVTDRPTKAHEYVFLLTKSARYYYDADAVREEPLPQYARPSSLVREHQAWAHPDDQHARRFADTTAARNVSHPNGRNLRSVWTIATAPYPEAHFATFPPELARRCIVAGTNARGCCAVCGTPGTRRVAIEQVRCTSGGSGHSRRGDARRHAATRTDLPHDRTTKHVTTIGWNRPVCTHDAGTVPCTVLDPFAGSGTVGEVAEQNGRDAVLIELSPAYVELARARTAQRGLFASQDATCRS